MTSKKLRSGVGLDEQARTAVVERLDRHLAELTDLYGQAKQAHWNVRGPRFHLLHVLFDQVAATVLPLIDPLAERIVTLGGIAHGSVRAAAAGSTLKEPPAHGPEDALLQSLAESMQACAQAIHASIGAVEEHGDALTGDLLIETCAELDKSLWMVTSHLP